MIVGFKMQIYPTKEQEFILKEYCKIYHNMWNFLVEKYKDELPMVNSIGIKGLSPKQLSEDYGFNVPKRISMGVIKTFAYSIKRFYQKIGNKPKFHKYNPNKQSFYVSGMTYLVNNGYIIIPSTKKGNAEASRRILLDLEYLRKYNITEVIEPRYTCYKGKWYLSGSYKKPDVLKSDKEFIGLDWGIKTFMTTSNGEFINYPKTIKREFYRIRKIQSILDKKNKHSKNWGKLNKKIQKAYDKLENLKKAFIEKETTRLSKDNSIAVENITKDIRSKKFICRQSYIAPRRRFIDKLKWKCEKFGSYFIEVNPAYTTQKCCRCGKIHNLNLKDRIMDCECGNYLDRDINAAINIKNDALASMDICCIY